MVSKRMDTVSGPLLRDVGPRGGGGGGGRVSDRELLKHVSDGEAIRQMLRTTAMPSRVFPRSDLSIPPGLIRKAGRPGRTPSVAASARRMVTLAGGPLGSPEIEPLVEGAPRRSSTGVPIMVGFNQIGSCGSAHGAYSGLYNGAQPGSNPACGVGFTPQESFADAFAKATAIRANSGIVQVLSVTNGILPGTKRRRETWQRPAGVLGRLSWSLRDPGIPWEEGEGGSSAGAGASGSWAPEAFAPVDVERKKKKARLPRVVRHMATVPRVRRRLTLRGYEKPGVQYEVVPGAKGVPPVLSKPVGIVHREVPTKTEKKPYPQKTPSKLLGAYHTMTEVFDLFDALSAAIPDGRCENMPGFRKMACVISNWDLIDPAQAAKNILANEIEDQLVGRLQGRLADALKKGGGPNSTQVNQWARQLNQLMRR